MSRQTLRGPALTSQALLDVYTISREIGRLENFSIALVGDLANGRTVRSLAYLLSMYPGVKMYFVAPEVVRMKDDIKQYLDRCDRALPPTFCCTAVLLCSRLARCCIVGNQTNMLDCFLTRHSTARRRRFAPRSEHYEGIAARGTDVA